MKTIHADILAKITLFPTKEGGREKNVQSFPDAESTYRCDHDLLNEGILTMGPVYLKEGQVLELGKTYEVKIRFIAPESVRKKIFGLKPKHSWKIYEGNRCVGRCEFVTYM